MEFWLLIGIAVLEVIDGRGLALRILRILSTVIGGESNVKKVESQEVEKVK